MPDTEAIYLDTRLWSILWQDIERSNRNTKFYDLTELTKCLETPTEVEKHPISSKKSELVMILSKALMGATEQVKDEAGKEVVLSLKNAIQCIASGNEFTFNGCVNFQDSQSELLKDCLVGPRISVIRDGTGYWEIIRSWQLEDVLLQQELSLPELYKLGKEMVIQWLSDLEKVIPEDWAMGDSRYWLEAFKDDAAVMGDTSIRQQVKIRLLALE